MSAEKVFLFSTDGQNWSRRTPVTNGEQNFRYLAFRGEYFAELLANGQVTELEQTEDGDDEFISYTILNSVAQNAGILPVSAIHSIQSRYRNQLVEQQIADPAQAHNLELAIIAQSLS